MEGERGQGREELRLETQAGEWAVGEAPCLGDKVKALEAGAGFRLLALLLMTSGLWESHLIPLWPG